MHMHACILKATTTAIIITKQKMEYKCANTLNYFSKCTSLLKEVNNHNNNNNNELI